MNCNNINTGIHGPHLVKAYFSHWRHRISVKMSSESSSEDEAPSLDDSSSSNNNNNNNNSLMSYMGSIFSGFFGFLSIPVQLIYHTVIGICRFALSIIWNDHDPLARDPLAELTSYIQRFELKYGRNHPEFFISSYNTAVIEAKSKLKFLLIFIHSDMDSSPNHSPTDSFIRNVLLDQLIIDYIKNNNLIFWSIDAKSFEGQRVIHSVHESSGKSFLALITMQKDLRNRNQRMTVVKKFDINDSISNVDLFLSQLLEVMEEHEHGLDAARAERTSLNINQQIRQEQDKAFEESLKADQEKERMKRERREKKHNEERLKKEKEDTERNLRDRLKDLKANFINRVPPEPENNDPDVIHLLVKLPNGQRLERRFLRDSSIKFLYYFIFSHDSAPFKFQVTTNFPRMQLPSPYPTLDNPECIILEKGGKKDPPTFREVGLTAKSEVLFVHDLEA